MIRRIEWTPVCSWESAPLISLRMFGSLESHHRMYGLYCLGNNSLAILLSSVLPHDEHVVFTYLIS